MARKQAGDPRYMVARFKGHCSECDHPIDAGTRILYWPNGKQLFCPDCADPHYARFLAEVAHEEAYAGAWS